jgi:hypothetical protein
MDGYSCEYWFVGVEIISNEAATMEKCDFLALF